MKSAGVPASLNRRAAQQTKKSLGRIARSNRFDEKTTKSQFASSAVSKPAVDGRGGGEPAPRSPPSSPSDHAEARYTTQTSGVTDRDLFLDVLSATATKREARSYLSLYRPATAPSTSKSSSPASGTDATATTATTKSALREGKDSNRRNQVNLGNLFPLARSIEASPKFVRTEQQALFADPSVKEPLRTALVYLKASETDVDDATLQAVGRTLSQLLRLGLSPVVVVNGYEGEDAASSPLTHRDRARRAVDRVVSAIEKTQGQTARRLDGAIGLERSVARESSVEASSTEPCWQTRVISKSLVLNPLYRGVIPVIAPLAIDEDNQKVISIAATEVILALTRELAGLAQTSDSAHGVPSQSTEKPISLDRLIILDTYGGIPNAKRLSGSHVFINLAQEYSSIEQDLRSTDSESRETSIPSHLANLRLARDTLSLLPPSSSAFIATPSAAAHIGRPANIPSATPGVGTRPHRNPLIHNLLTDKPAFSSSLPQTRVSNNNNTTTNPEAQPHSNHTQHPTLPPPHVPRPPTFIKRGMPITIFPDPRTHPWHPPSSSSSPPQFSILSDPNLSLPRLIHLIEDSFKRPLDAAAYFARIAPRLAGIIIAGNYEGGAILTWEKAPDNNNNNNTNNNNSKNNSKNDTNYPRLVPYLDKFAVLSRSQGAGGVADIVFNAMTRDCFPRGVCWRSRSSNPVNKWYFERARGSWRIPPPPKEGVAEEEEEGEGEGGVEGGVEVEREGSGDVLRGSDVEDEEGQGQEMMEEEAKTAAKRAKVKVKTKTKTETKEREKEGWTMFWTTEGVDGALFADYEAVCSGLGSFWRDGKEGLD